MFGKLSAFVLMAIALTGGAARADQACLTEGRMMNEQIKDCSQTKMSIASAAYAAQCKETASVFAAMGGAGTATVLSACPAKAQGACINPFGTPVTTYYYARGPKSLADTKTSCVAQKGKWVDKP